MWMYYGLATDRMTGTTWQTRRYTTWEQAYRACVRLGRRHMPVDRLRFDVVTL